jgi:hypothetical protein
LIRKLIDQASTNITLLWVSSHVGIPGNKSADEAAKEALNEETHHTETYPPQDLKTQKNTNKNNKKNGKTPVYQVEFREHRSCTEQMKALTTHIEAGFQRQLKISVVFVELSAAYDTA